MIRRAVPPAMPDGVERITETHEDGAVAVFRHPQWRQQHPWLEQGITTRSGEDGGDFGLFGATPVADAQRRWKALRQLTGMPRAVHARQVHGATVLRQENGDAGLFIADAADGHATEIPGVLLTISVADCVPIYMIEPERRLALLLHAGWRGVAAGMLEAGFAMAGRYWDATPAMLQLHLGPAICGACYEVGEEVAAGIELARGDDAGDGPLHVDLRAALAARAIRAGARPDAITASTHCTRCGDGAFFSHRAGQPGRQVAFLGIHDRRH